MFTTKLKARLRRLVKRLDRPYRVGAAVRAQIQMVEIERRWLAGHNHPESVPWQIHVWRRYSQRVDSLKRRWGYTL